MSRDSSLRFQSMSLIVDELTYNFVGIILSCEGFVTMEKYKCVLILSKYRNKITRYKSSVIFHGNCCLLLRAAPYSGCSSWFIRFLFVRMILSTGVYVLWFHYYSQYMFVLILLYGSCLSQLDDIVQVFNAPPEGYSTTQAATGRESHSVQYLLPTHSILLTTCNSSNYRILLECIRGCLVLV